MQRLLLSLASLLLIAGLHAQAPFCPGETFEGMAPISMNSCDLVEYQGDLYGISAWPGPPNSTLTKYDIATGVSTVISIPPFPLGETSLTEHNGKLYIFGGWTGTSPSNQAHTYDIASNSWQNLPNMPVNMTQTSAVTLGNSIYITGGTLGVTVQHFLRFDVATNSYTTLTPPSNFTNSKLLVRGGQVLCLGGHRYGSGGFETSALFNVYDIASDTWQSLPNMPLPRTKIAATIWGDFLYVFGGYTVPPYVEHLDYFVFDLLASQWTVSTDLIPAPVNGAITVSDTIYLASAAGSWKYYCTGTAPPIECGISTSSDTVCDGGMVTLTATTTMPGVGNSGSQIFIPGGGVSDIDGNTYSSVIIGNQEWMAENLRTTRYQNGDTIPHLMNSGDWGTTSQGAWCHFTNDPAYEIPYGKLYNAFAAIDPRNVCPSGWHVASDAEWTALEQYLGGSSIAGGKLKETGTAHWLSPNTGATNESGFMAVGAEYRDVGGNWGPNLNAKVNGLFWTSTSDSINPLCWARRLGYASVDVLRENHVSTHGFSVRCVKNSTGLGLLEYDWSTGDSTASISVSPAQSTTYTVAITNGTDSCTASVTIVVAPLPMPDILVSGNMLSTTTVGTSYQWYLNGLAIPGAMNDTLDLSGNGLYTVEVTDALGCTGMSDPYPYFSTIVPSLDARNPRIYPNPSNGVFQLEMNHAGLFSVDVYDVSGRLVHSQVFQTSGVHTTRPLDLTDLAKGSYTVQVRSAWAPVSQLVVIE